MSDIGMSAGRVPHPTNPNCRVIEHDGMTATKESVETIDHPSHYNVGSIEVIDVIDDWGLGFSLGNAVKYIARAGHKGDAVEDLRKAAWYINHEIERRCKCA